MVIGSQIFILRLVVVMLFVIESRLLVDQGKTDLVLMHIPRKRMVKE